jgi:translation initiation factor IF-3
VNEAIRAREVRAVFPDGSVEIMPTSAAVRKAQDMGLDLILIAPTAEPPVAKAMDYGQWQYENKKKQHEAKRKQHVIQVKELKFRPNTDDHDYDFKKNHAIRFLKEGNRVKAVVQFRGREIAHTDIGRKLLSRFAEDLAQHGVAQRPHPAESGKGRVAAHPGQRKRKAQAGRIKNHPVAFGLHRILGL